MGLLDNNKIITTPLTGLEGSMLKKIASTEDYDVFFNSDSKRLRLTYRDIYAWSDDTALYLVRGKITDTPTKILINSTNFPNLVGTPKIVHVIACPCVFSIKTTPYGNHPSLSGNKERVCVIFDNGQIYHNLPSCHENYDFYNSTWATRIEDGDEHNMRVEELFTSFDESVVWDLPSRKHPVKTQSGTDAELIATGCYYYNPALADDSYDFHPALNAANGYGNNGFPATNDENPAGKSYQKKVLRPRFWRPNMGNSNCNPFTYMGGYVNDERFTMIGTYRSNEGANGCRICVFGTQDGGRSWYCMYEFGSRDRLAYEEQYMQDDVPSTRTVYVTASATYGASLAETGNVGANVYKMKRRTINLPDEIDKEPSVVFTYDKELNISSIVGNSEGITVTTESSHGLNNGDCVVIDYRDGVLSDNRAFDWMVNSSADSTTGGNGVLFKVSNASESTFKLSLYIWNPDALLPVRHIHALNRCKDGVSVSCGESYESGGGWIMYLPIIGADSFDEFNVADTRNVFVRLNSTKYAFQRPLGAIVQQEGKDTFCYIGMDHARSTMNNVALPDGRTDTIKHNSVGVWKASIDEIDSQKDNGLIKLNSTQTCFGFQQILDAIVFIGQYGELAISFDCCESWSITKLPSYSENTGQNLCHFSGPTYDRKFSIDNYLVQLKK